MPARDDGRVAHALLFLKAIILDYLSVEEPPVGVVFGLDDYAGLFGLAFFGLRMTRVSKGNS
ncbi:a84eac45-6bd1-46d1-abd0-37b370c49a64 [Thermothielavioides terrestris]|uniref:A84eac45-6bd1-46d1-abd0-37b370c49a64 n=1 Tax=Thermothielavioides terrestris TaxID=2587410 RepID=A0A3S4C7Y4_9PEZI|nr:a84eac45-6bd1-46d1-abd0-37b370c49a64 [Thermothielavioides terrestris]